MCYKNSYIILFSSFPHSTITNNDIVLTLLNILGNVLMILYFTILSCQCFVPMQKVACPLCCGAEVKMWSKMLVCLRLDCIVTRFFGMDVVGELDAMFQDQFSCFKVDVFFRHGPGVVLCGPPHKCISRPLFTHIHGRFVSNDIKIIIDRVILVCLLKSKKGCIDVASF